MRQNRAAGLYLTEIKTLDSKQNKTLDTTQNKTLGTTQDKTLDTTQNKTLDTTQNKTLGTTQDKTLDATQNKTLDTTQNKTLDTMQNKTLDTTQNKTLDTTQNKTLDTTQNKTLVTRETKPPSPPGDYVCDGQNPTADSRRTAKRQAGFKINFVAHLECYNSPVLHNSPVASQQIQLSPIAETLFYETDPRSGKHKKLNLSSFETADWHWSGILRCQSF